MNAHTPGRLQPVEHYSDSISIVDSGGFQIFEAKNIAILLDYAGKLGVDHWADDPRARLELNTDEQAANARRLVACWNACEGISTEDLTRYYSKQFGIDAAREEASLRDHVKAHTERDEMLAALRLAAEINPYGNVENAAARDAARAVIAKVEGGAT